MAIGRGGSSGSKPTGQITDYVLSRFRAEDDARRAYLDAAIARDREIELSRRADRCPRGHLREGIRTVHGRRRRYCLTCRVIENRARALRSKP